MGDGTSSRSPVPSQLPIVSRLRCRLPLIREKRRGAEGTKDRERLCKDDEKGCKNSHSNEQIGSAVGNGPFFVVVVKVIHLHSSLFRDCQCEKSQLDSTIEQKQGP